MTRRIKKAKNVFNFSLFHLNYYLLPLHERKCEISQFCAKCSPSHIPTQVYRRLSSSTTAQPCERLHRRQRRCDSFQRVPPGHTNNNRSSPSLPLPRMPDGQISYKYVRPPSHICMYVHKTLVNDEANGSDLRNFRNRCAVPKALT